MMVRMLVKNFLKFFFLYIFMHVSTVYGQIAKISKITALNKIIQEIDPETLVIFDVDHVIIMPTDEYSFNRNSYRKHLWKEISSRYPEEEAKFLRSIAILATKWTLVEDDIIKIFSNLKNRNISTIALTAYVTGKFGIIEKMEDLRIKQLNSVGIGFNNSTPLQGKIVINKLNNQYGVPMLKSNIIFTTEMDKSKVLQYVFINANYYPKSILFIDDQLNNLESVEKMCENLDIKFKGIHYTAVSNIPEFIIDEDMEKLRFFILEREHRWLSYKELGKLYNNKRVARIMK